MAHCRSAIAQGCGSGRCTTSCRQLSRATAASAGRGHRCCHHDRHGSAPGQPEGQFAGDGATRRVRWDAGVGLGSMARASSLWPHSATFRRTLVLDSLGQPAPTPVAGIAWVGIGRRIYRAALSSGRGTACCGGRSRRHTPSGLALYQDDLLILLSTGQEISARNTSNSQRRWMTGAGEARGGRGRLCGAPCMR